MTSDVTEPQPASAASNEVVEALLDTANSASQHVAVLHVAFMALCAYVLVIVFGTTDMDLLIGKDVKLPVVDVAVSIVGFYAFAPYLVVLVHFNLLLQLQLLSRKLYALDAAAPEEERIGFGLRDRLHIFPFTYYLVGRPGPMMRRLLGFVVGITLLALPLATLLVLQVRFLAYQDQAITWGQRVAVWLDVALVIALWPVIMDRGDSWRDYLRQVGSYLRRHWEMGFVWAALWVVTAASSFETTIDNYLALVVAILFVLSDWRRRSIPAPTVDGGLGLLLIVALGVPLPLTLLAEGEWWEEKLKLLVRKVELSESSYRRLNLSEQVLLAKPAKPEFVAQFREGDPENMKDALKKIERVKLGGRSLQGANFNGALLPGADLRGARLQGANLEGAQLQNADLRAQLQGAWLREAQLQGANLEGADLQGANLEGAQLQGANLGGAEVQGADLRSAELYGAIVEESDTTLVDVRAAGWTPLEQERLAQIRKMLGEMIADARRKEEALERIERAGNAGLDPPILESCLIDPGVTPELNCEQKWLPAEVEAFRTELFPALKELACQSSAIAGGLIRQIDQSETTSGRFGLTGRFAALLDDRECEGLSSLREADKNLIRVLARREEEHRAQSWAGKPAKDVPGSRAPPPAIAPETP